MSIEFPIINTDRLLLRQFIDCDLENIFKGLSDPDVIKYYGISYQSVQAAKAQMDFYSSIEKDGTGLFWAITSAIDAVFYGTGGLYNLSKEHKKAEVGFWLLPEFWSKGIMKEAMPAICNYGFEKLGLHRIEGYVETENINCKKAMDKLGFCHEGIMADCEIKNGKFIGLDIYAKLNNS